MTEEFRRACQAIGRVGSGSIRTTRGTVVSGRYFDYESEWDDPTEDGYISLEGDDGRVRDVYSSEFAELLEPKEPC